MANTQVQPIELSRIGRRLLLSKKTIKDTLMISLKVAFEEYEKYLKPEYLLKKMNNVWEEYERNEIDRSHLKETKIYLR